jgi:beta-fructofuranosidase
MVHHVVTGELVIDRDHASLDPRVKEHSWRLPSEVPNATLRILLDHSVAEVFTASGRTLTLRVYPVADGPWRVQMGATGAASDAYTVGAGSDTAEPLVGDTATRRHGDPSGGRYRIARNASTRSGRLACRPG